MGTAFTIVIFFAVIILTAVLFGAWILVSIVRVTMSLIGGMFNSFRRRSGTLSLGQPGRCGNARCLAANPGDARFCRRCGQQLPQVQHVPVRRAAVW